MSLARIKKEMLKKLEALQKAGLEIYPMKTKRLHRSQSALDNFEEWSLTKKEIFLAGRLKSTRLHGGSCFAHLEDESAAIQLYFKKDTLGSKKYQLFIDNFEKGDFIQVNGLLFQTKAGEKTLEVKDYKILAKILSPLPEEWHGLKDKEERLRRRYLDLLLNKETKKRFEIRSQIIRDLRKFLESDGFMEVETPILQDLPGGALARPFKTHLHALDLDLYLRVSPELYLKRLLVGGFEKIYEMGRCFRNEGIDFSHNPDFTLLEFYWAYADYEDLMNLTERMFDFLAPSLLLEYEGQKINLTGPWKRIELMDLIKDVCGFDLIKIETKDLLKEVKKYGLKFGLKTPRFKIIDEIYKKVCRPKLIQPTFVVHHPIVMSPLAKALPGQPTKAARFQLVVAGLELVNAYSELNDPREQAKRLRAQEKERQQGKELEAHRYDKDFIEALEYGMPPAAGFGLGVDRLVALLTGAHSLREAILFPTMKPKKK